MKTWIAPAIGFIAVGAALGSFYTKWQIAEDCLYLSGTKINGKVFVCEGMTESVNLQVLEEHAALKRPL